MIGTENFRDMSSTTCPQLLAIYHQTALTGKAWVALPKGLLSDLGVSRDTKARALAHLRAAGIVEVRNEKGRPSSTRLSEVKVAKVPIENLVTARLGA
jgi:hypothetical protein